MKTGKGLLGALFLMNAAIAAASTAPEYFGISSIVASRSGYWAGGASSNGDLALLKYDNHDSLVFAKPFGAAQGFRDQEVYGFAPLIDGGAIVIGVSNTGINTPPPAYTLYRVDSAGTLLWSIPQSYGTSGTAFLGADNSGGAWFPYNGQIYRVDGDGSVLDFGQVSTTLNDVFAGAVDPVTSNLYLVTPTGANLLNPGSLIRYTAAPSYTTTKLWTSPDPATQLQFLTVGSDGNVYAIGNNSSSHIAMSFTPTGSVRWSKTFGSSLYTFSTHSSIATRVAALPDGSIVALDTSGVLTKVSASGQITQIPDTAYQADSNLDTTVEVSPQGDIILFNGRILRLTSTGQVLLDSGFPQLPVVLADDTMLTTNFVPNGDIYVVHLDRTGNQVGTPFLPSASLATPAQTRVDQIGLDGAWYATAESGQGFTIDYVASSNVLFIPWFTYSVDPVNDTTGLAWVSFQGSPTPGATSATLQIARTEPGTFNTGSVPADVVGTAVLTATDCSNARLQYKFNEGVLGGIGGYMPLVRLSPSTTPCIGANGQTTPPSNTNSPLHGFDSNQSGSWYDPNTSGQGIELTIVPAGNGLGGLVFGAWFTFDAPPPNDAEHEHWFTLQGDMSTALNGTVNLPIVQNVGGSLDSLPSTGYAEVGTVTLTMLSCTSATMVYQFGHSAAAGNFAGLNGTINLMKIGGCVTP